MRNINTDALFLSGQFASVDPERGIIDIRGAYKDIPSVQAIRFEGDLLGIKSLKFMLSVNAIEPLTGPRLSEGETPVNTVFFDHEYELCYRITETHSRMFVDLNTYSFVPQDSQISLCRKVYSNKILCQFQNISVAIPPQGKDLCVLKILIRPTGYPQAEWIVQSVHPIRLVFDR